MDPSLLSMDCHHYYTIRRPQLESDKLKLEQTTYYGAML